MGYRGRSWDADKRIRAECYLRRGLALWRLDVFPASTLDLDRCLEETYDDGIAHLMKCLSRKTVSTPESKSYKFHNLFLALQLLSNSSEWRQAKEIVAMGMMIRKHSDSKQSLTLSSAVKSDTIADYACFMICKSNREFQRAIECINIPIEHGLDCSGKNHSFLYFQRAQVFCYLGNVFLSFYGVSSGYCR